MKNILIIILYLITGFLLSGAFLSLRVYNLIDNNIDVNRNLLLENFQKSLLQSYICILFPFAFMIVRNIKKKHPTT